MEIYYDDVCRKTVDKGEYRNHRFWVVSFGSHPCAYVELSKDDLYYTPAIMEKYSDIPIDVHGGLTYLSNHLVKEAENTAIIGWDYAHSDDFMNMPYLRDLEGKKWTLKEIRKDIESVIDQLIQKNDDFYKEKSYE